MVQVRSTALVQNITNCFFEYWKGLILQGSIFGDSVKSDFLHQSRLSYVLMFAPMGVVACGVLHTALESAVEALSTKVSMFSGKILREQAPTQELIARSRAALRAAHLGFVTVMEAVWEVACTGAAVSLK